MTRSYNANSARNGAGNRRYTPEERERVDAQRALEQEQKIRVDRLAAELEAHEPLMKSLTEKLFAQKLRCSIPYRKRLNPHNWVQTILPLTCVTCESTFEMTANAVATTKNKYVCKECARLSANKNSAAARDRFNRKLDEQSLDLVELTSLAKKCTVRDRISGEEYGLYPQNIDKWTRAKDTLAVFFIVDETDEYIFAWMGPLPNTNNEAIMHLVDNGTIQEVENSSGVKDLAAFIEECNESGDKVLNVALNPNWIEGDTYTWGSSLELINSEEETL